VKRHELDVVSLVFGLLFGAVASWWGVNQLGNLNIPLGWPLAAALLVAGLVGLVGALPRRGREDDRTGSDLASSDLIGADSGSTESGTAETGDTPVR
jgi:hypothetical protein